MEKAIIDLSRNCTLLASLSADDTRTFCEYFSIEEVGADQVIISQGDTSRVAYIILEGQMGVRSHFLQEKDGTVPFRTIIAKMGPGEIVGEFSLLDAGPRSAEVYAITDARVLVIDRERFERFSQKHPHIGYVVIKNLALILINRIRQTNLKLKAALEWGWGAGKPGKE